MIYTFWDFFVWKLMSSIARIRSRCALCHQKISFKHIVWWFYLNSKYSDSLPWLTRKMQLILPSMFLYSSSVYQPVIVGYCSTLEVQQLTGVNLAGLPGVLGASRSCVGHMKDVVTGHGQGSIGTSSEGHVDTNVEGVSGRCLTVLQLLQQRLIVWTGRGGHSNLSCCIFYTLGGFFLEYLAISYQKKSCQVCAFEQDTWVHPSSVLVAPGTLLTCVITG